MTFNVMSVVTIVVIIMLMEMSVLNNKNDIDCPMYHFTYSVKSSVLFLACIISPSLSFSISISLPPSLPL